MPPVHMLVDLSDVSTGGLLYQHIDNNPAVAVHLSFWTRFLPLSTFMATETTFSHFPRMSSTTLVTRQPRPRLRRQLPQTLLTQVFSLLPLPHPDFFLTTRCEDVTAQVNPVY